MPKKDKIRSSAELVETILETAPDCFIVVIVESLEQVAEAQAAGADMCLVRVQAPIPNAPSSKTSNETG